MKLTDSLFELFTSHKHGYLVYPCVLNFTWIIMMFHLKFGIRGRMVGIHAHLKSINQSKCYAKGQTQHSPLYPLFRLPFRIFLQSIYHNVGYHLISSSASNFLLIYHTFQSIFQFLLSQWPSQFLFLSLISSSIIFPTPTLSSTTALFILSVHFTRNILLHIHISTASSCFRSFRRRVQVSASYNTTLYTKHFTSLFHSYFPRARRKCFFFC